MSKDLEHLLSHIDIIEARSDELLAAWLDVADVKERLVLHDIECDFFAKFFGSKVVDYAIGVVQGRNDLGNCPVIGVMLILFKKKKIPLHDVFIICVNLKNSLLLLLQKEGLLDQGLLEEAALLMDLNFEGVIKEYTELYYFDVIRPETCLLPSTVTDEDAVEELKVVSGTLSDIKVTSAVEFAADVEVDRELIDELNELESDVLYQLEFNETISDEMYHNIVTLFEQYSRALNLLMEFGELAYTINVLTNLLRDQDAPSTQESPMDSIAIYLKAIITDLQHWKESVLIEQSAEDIHYLDKTLLSSIAQLELMLMPPVESEDDGIEFF